MNDYELYLVKRAYYKKQAYFTETPEKRRFNKALDGLYLSQKSLNKLNKATDKNRLNLYKRESTVGDPEDDYMAYWSAPPAYNPEVWHGKTPISNKSIYFVRKNRTNQNFDSTATIKSMRRQIDKAVKAEQAMNKQRKKSFNNYMSKTEPAPGFAGLGLKLDRMFRDKFIEPRVYTGKDYK